MGRERENDENDIKQIKTINYLFEINVEED